MTIRMNQPASLEYPLQTLPNGRRGLVLALYLDLETPVDHMKDLEEHLARGEVRADNDPRDPANVARWEAQAARSIDQWFDAMGLEACFEIDSSIVPTLLRILSGMSPNCVRAVGANDVLASAIDGLRPASSRPW